MYIREYNHFVSDAKGKVIGGIHPYHEVLFVLVGELNLHWLGSVFKAKAPALFIFPPSSPHQIVQVSPFLECWFVELRPQDKDYVPGIDNLNTWNVAQSQNPLSLNENEDLCATLGSIQRAIVDDLPKKQGDTFLHIMMCDIQKLLLQVNYYAQKQRCPQELLSAEALPDKWSAQSYIYDQIRYMEDNYMQGITLDDLAKRSGYTPSYIIRLFKEMTTLTPLQYLFELRMDAATSYLQSTPMSVQEIAETVGFPNIHYFSRMFKKKFGESPTEWKRTHVL
ncbi:AraC family transcriptional regulator [Paenibacillus nasutitermitis]|uniref:AraC family transcriptional regulator n=1 Tax=Paenibacillus nasutitermitis TaxID=1652958 RepID=A0A917DXM2_9BACL|nr:AraC family transcriptional regulator [Paenibacillus nasutitermitis]GGD79901.1 AraC family transcriptional regulator [Paenibacillus nasutitermitis]